MNRELAVEKYTEAHKAAEKCFSDCEKKGVSPYPAVLDTILKNVKIVGTQDLGIINIPTELVVGTKTEGRDSAFAANFMPLFKPTTEFGSKWIALCCAHLSETGIHDPIQCYEYLGKFYILEGNKRFSVLKSFDAPSVLGTVTRLLPEKSHNAETDLYYEFVDFYKLSKLYSVVFHKPGSYKLLQAAMGFSPNHTWTEDERRSFTSLLYYIKRILAKLGYDILLTGDVVLALLKVYSFTELKDMSLNSLTTSIKKLLPEINLLDNPDPIAVSTSTPDNPKSGIQKIFNSIVSGHLNVAFINEYPAQNSPWINAHEMGRQYIDEKFGNRINTTSYTVTDFDSADSTFEKAINDGAEVVFATTPSLIAVSRKAALKHPNVKILVCSVSMPFPEIRTYYSRMYEGKFISGAIAGALTKNGKIGYAASSPIYGVPAGINAFALGASLTNPDAKIILRWTSVCIDTFSELKDLGIDMLTNRDMPMNIKDQDVWGLSQIDDNGNMIPVCAPYWNWGEIYSHIVNLILTGAWNDIDDRDSGKAINYWLGLDSGAVDIRLSENLPDGVRELANILKSGISAGTILPFKRKIYDQNLVLRNDGIQSLSTEEILRMNWLCSSVEGSIPEYDELLPIAKNIVSLQGIYRENIVPEKGRPIL